MPFPNFTEVVTNGKLNRVCLQDGGPSTKREMDDLLRATLASRGISQKRTCVGRDVICRIGDPSKVQKNTRDARSHVWAIDPW